MVRQLHIPEAGELVHEEGVLFDDGVENILGIKARDTVKTVRWAGRMVLAVERHCSTCVRRRHRWPTLRGTSPSSALGSKQ